MGKKTKVVIDTNVLISAFGWHGKPEEVVNLVTAGRIKNFISLEMLVEFRKVVAYPKLNFSETQTIIYMLTGKLDYSKVGLPTHYEKEPLRNMSLQVFSLLIVFHSLPIFHCCLFTDWRLQKKTRKRIDAIIAVTVPNKKVACGPFTSHNNPARKLDGSVINPVIV